MAKLFISGIPGTGKTTVAEHLAQHFGYQHIDMEADSFRARRELANDAEGFLGKLAATENVVISWGFSPFIDRPGVDQLLSGGYTMVWLDGDHVASLRNFLAREKNDPHHEANYYGQMQMIISTELVERLQPICVNPFQNGQFRPVEEIVSEVIAKTTEQL
ncbi:MAG TPA: AAA family ATPase [Patescibacteria group bacterium]|nr:AAA family ATPase [Patescibacteria group bacterium]